MLATLLIFTIGLNDPQGEPMARGMAFVTLVLGNLGLVLTNRSTKKSMIQSLIRPNPAMITVFVITVTALALSLWVPGLRTLFGFAPLPSPRMLEAAAAALGTVIINDTIGTIWRLHMSTHRNASS